MAGDWLQRIEERGGFPSREAAERAAVETLRVLSARLVADEARALSESLPPRAARAIQGGRHEGDFSLEEFYQRVAARLDERQSIAMEQAQVVCAVLAREMPSSVRERLQRHLPDFAELFEVEARWQPPEAAQVLKASPPERHDLAEGRPGSRHPLSEARPDTAHQHSVARNDDPHGETKLSSARGLTQEREGETLATGTAQARRKMSDA